MLDSQLGSNHLVPWVSTMTKSPRSEARILFKQNVWTTHPPSLLGSLTTDCTKFFCGAKKGFMWGYGEAGASRDGHHHTVKPITSSRPHTLTPSHPHTLTPSHSDNPGQARVCIAHLPMVRSWICNRIDKTARVKLPAAG